MRYILIFTTILIIFAMLLSSCIIEGIDNFISGEDIQEETPGKDQESNENIDRDKYDNKDPDGKSSGYLLSETSDDADSQEITGRPENNLMFYSFCVSP